MCANLQNTSIGPVQSQLSLRIDGFWSSMMWFVVSTHDTARKPKECCLSRLVTAPMVLMVMCLSMREVHFLGSSAFFLCGEAPILVSKVSTIQPKSCFNALTPRYKFSSFSGTASPPPVDNVTWTVSAGQRPQWWK
jgi:hypothetical protein